MRISDDRRRILQAGGLTLTVGLAGCLDFLQEEIEFDDEVPDEVADHLSNANNVDGSITDRTGEEELTIENGPNGDLAYWSSEPQVTGWRQKTIYFLPSCSFHEPKGQTGGENFGILARIPVLVD